MSARALLDRLAAAGLSVTADDGRLLIRPAAKFTDALRAEVVAAKPELLALLGRAQPQVDSKVTRQPPKVSGETTKRDPEGGGAAPPALTMVSSKVSPERAPLSKHEQKLELQRQRRTKRTRIDFYASAEAARVIDALRYPAVGGDASSIINRALIEWGALPEFRYALKAAAAERPTQ